MKTKGGPKQIANAPGMPATPPRFCSTKKNTEETESKQRRGCQANNWFSELWYIVLQLTNIQNLKRKLLQCSFVGRKARDQLQQGVPQCMVLEMNSGLAVKPKLGISANRESGLHRLVRLLSEPSANGLQWGTCRNTVLMRDLVAPLHLVGMWRALPHIPE